ncbi:MAG: MFS transporter [Phycisphaerales bacterium JB063]
MSDPVNAQGQSNQHRLIFIASFLTLIAAGVGFAIRGGILKDWAGQYGFTMLELGTITGGGLLGFGIIIMLSSLITDRVGYKTILLAAFVMHVLSAIVTLAATPVFNAMGKGATYWCLYIGMFMFAVGNGLCEGAINPLVADLYPKKKTHYLNILHAGWPGGLIVGGLLGFLMVGKMRWEIPLALFLIPTLAYGLITLKEKFPVSHAHAAGIKFGEMLKQFAAPLLIIILILQACVGYVELGTDSWISNITGAILQSPQQGLLLFVYASAIMFTLRFFAGPIVERINPIGLLCVSSAIGATGLLFLSSAKTAVLIWVAVTIYSLGKTFLWPTMLGVVGEKFPRGGAVTMGAVGAVGMLSAGLLGGPGIGYKQDANASSHLEAESPETYERYAASEENSFLGVFSTRGLDGAKVGVILDQAGPGTDLERTVAIFEEEGVDSEFVDNLHEWWQDSEQYAEADKPLVGEATIHGGRMALKLTAAVPAFMAVSFLMIALYFRAKGGYKAEHIHEHPEDEITSGQA